jgi:hypothetical protein
MVGSLLPSSFSNLGTSDEAHDGVTAGSLDFTPFATGPNTRASILSPLNMAYDQMSSFGQKFDTTTQDTSYRTDFIPTRGISNSSPMNTYEIFCTPDDNQLGLMCKGIVGQGAAFCIKLNCDVRAHKVKKADVYPNYVYVVKPNLTAFVKPCFPRSKIDDACLVKLKKARLNLGDWSKKMTIINKVNKIATIDTVKIEQLYVEQSINHKTPLKTSNKGADTLQYFDLTRYKRQLDLIGSSGEAFSDNVPVDRKSIRPMDEGLHETLSNLLRLIASHENALVELSSVTAKVDNVASIVGNHVLDISEEYHAPTLWESVAVLATHINRINDTVIDIDPKLLKLQSEYLASTYDINLTLDACKTDNTKNLEIISALTGRMDKLRDTVMRSCESVSSNTKRSKENFEVLNHEIGEIRNVRSRTLPTTSVGGSMFDQNEVRTEIERVSKVNDELRIMFRNLSAQANKEAIKFCNLGFRTFQDAGAWIDINFPDHSYGLNMSAFTVLEHIHQSFT